MSNKITTPREEYTDLLEDVSRNRDAVAGERQVKSKTVEYSNKVESLLSAKEVDIMTI